MSLMNQTVNKVSAYATKMLKEDLPPDLYFHDWYHTNKVASVSYRIAEASEVSGDDFEVLMIAAWFHDLGFVKSYNEHEKYSEELAESFLMNWNYESEKLTKVINCIKATRMPQSPNTFLERILCDADMAHLGSHDYLNRLTLLRKEWFVKLKKTCKDEQWYMENVRFLERHKYFTLYGWAFYHGEKLKNRDRLKSLIRN